MKEPRVSAFSVAFISVALPNVALGIYLVTVTWPHFLHADDMGEALLTTIVLLAGVSLWFFAAPALWWARTAPRRERKANQRRFAAALLLVLVSFVPVLLVTWEFIDYGN